MIRSILLALFQFVLNVFVLAQTSDTVPARQPDSLRHETKTLMTNSPLTNDSLNKDSTSTPILTDTAWIDVALNYKNFTQPVFTQNSFFDFSSPAIVVRSDKKEFHGKELLFYTLIGLLLFL